MLRLLRRARDDADHASFHPGASPGQIGLGGGTKFDPANTSTHFTTAQQFRQWWKNNVERKIKYQQLVTASQGVFNGGQGQAAPGQGQGQGQGQGPDEGQGQGQAQRAAYCRLLIALVDNIKVPYLFIQAPI
jgi:hypothetical protein